MQIETKPLPFAVTKKQLVEMYINQMTERAIISAINEIINDFRKIPNNKAKRVLHREFKEFVEIFGLPKGYR